MKYLGLSAILTFVAYQAIAAESGATSRCKPAVESAAQELNKKTKEFTPLLSEENQMMVRARMDKRQVDTSRFVQMTSALNAAKIELCLKFEDAYEISDTCTFKDSEGKDVSIVGDDLLKDCKGITKVTETK